MNFNQSNVFHSVRWLFPIFLVTSWSRAHRTSGANRNYFLAIVGTTKRKLAWFLFIITSPRQRFDNLMKNLRTLKYPRCFGHWFRQLILYVYTFKSLAISQRKMAGRLLKNPEHNDKDTVHESSTQFECLDMEHGWYIGTWAVDQASRLRNTRCK